MILSNKSDKCSRLWHPDIRWITYAGESFSFVVKPDMCAKYAWKVSSKTGLSYADQQQVSWVHPWTFHGRTACGCLNKTVSQRLWSLNVWSRVGGDSGTMMEKVCYRKQTLSVYGPNTALSLLHVRSWGCKQPAFCFCWCLSLVSLLPHHDGFLSLWNHKPK